MAITVIQAPGDTFASASAAFSLHTPLWHVATSSNSSYPDFRFIADVNVAGQTIRLKVSPDANGYGTIDVSRILRAYIQNYFALRDSIFWPFIIDTDAITLTYFVDWGEDYLGVEHPALFGVTCYAYNAYSSDTPGGSPYEPLIGFQHNWATTRPLDIRVPKDKNMFLSYVNDPDENLRLRVEEIAEDGTPSGAPQTTAPINVKRLFVLNLTPAGLNSLFVSPPISSTAEGFRIAVYRDLAFSQTEWVNVRWLCEPKSPATALHFLNRFGGFDTFYFTGPTRKELNVDSKQYQRIGALPFGELNSTNQVYNDTVISMSTKQMWTRKLSSGYVNDQTHEWLWQLIASPQVYLEYEGSYYPVQIKTKKWSERLERFDKMYNLELEIEMGRQVYSQFR